MSLINLVYQEIAFADNLLDNYLDFLPDVEHITVEFLVFVVQLHFKTLTGNKFFGIFNIYSPIGTTEAPSMIL